LQLHQACESVAIILIVAGILLFIDGVGSILIRFGQKHSLLFDLERAARTILAILIAIIGLHLGGIRNVGDKLEGIGELQEKDCRGLLALGFTGIFGTIAAIAIVKEGTGEEILTKVTSLKHG